MDEVRKGEDDFPGQLCFVYVVACECSVRTQNHVPQKLKGMRAIPTAYPQTHSHAFRRTFILVRAIPSMLTSCFDTHNHVLCWMSIGIGAISCMSTRTSIKHVLSMSYVAPSQAQHAQIVSKQCAFSMLRLLPMF